jgi:hypothetical protein
MRIALGARDFRADHTMTAIHFFGDFAVSCGFRKAGPAASGVELGIGLEQSLTTADASIESGRGGLFVLPGKWRLGGFLARNRELDGGEILSPFVVGLFDFVGHLSLRQAGAGS